MVRSPALRALIVVALWSGSASAQIPSTFVNLQVLPKDIPRPELIATMRGIATGLGVRCNHCHVGPDDLAGMDFATDEKQTKKMGRLMLQMVQTINREYVAKLPPGETPRQQVTCATCHRGSAIPPRAPAAAGIGARLVAPI